VRVHQNLNDLNVREKDVLRLLASGHDAKSAAQVLGVSVNAVNERLREARRKLGTTSSREAARLLHEAEVENSQENRDKNFKVDGAQGDLEDDDSRAPHGLVRASRLTLMGVGIMLIGALIWSLLSGSGDSQLNGSMPLPSASYAVAVEGTLQDQPIAEDRGIITAGGIASISSSGAFDLHFSVSADPRQDGKVIIAVNTVIPRKDATTRYSRALSVAEGEPAHFRFEPIGSSPSLGEISITARKSKPQP
jgi:DNA-binding CsgD family transcriptional regulator